LPSRECDRRPDEPLSATQGHYRCQSYLKDSCLEILLDLLKPNQQTLAAFVRQRIIRLRAAPIKQGNFMYGKQARKFQLESVELAAQPLPVVISQPSPLNLPSREQRSRRPDEPLFTT